jgi:hypothetical protein
MVRAGASAASFQTCRVFRNWSAAASTDIGLFSCRA